MKRSVGKRTNHFVVGMVAFMAFLMAFAGSYLLVTSHREPSRHQWGSTVVDDVFLRRLLPNHPEATVFRTEYLDFFAAEQPDERKVAEESKNRYILKGDFNKNGKPEVAIAGLLSTKPVRNKYMAFILIVEKVGSKYRRLFYFPLTKSVHPDPNVEEIKNLALSSDGGRELTVTFANQSGYFMKITWNGMAYSVSDDSEEEGGI